MFSVLKKIFGSAQDRMVRRYSKLVSEVNRFDAQFQSLTDSELKAKTEEFKQRLAQGASVDDILCEAYGVVKAACRRLIGQEVHVSGYNQKWDMVPYDVQIVGAIAMHKGSIAEMQTGEGKTLTAVMPLYLNALTGKPVHLVTVNDYLAKRDEEWVGSVLRYLGLTTAALMNETPPERRKAVYAADVVYGTASEFGFDYLRDNSMALDLSQQVQRGYYFAIIDETDSILIDEARTPLIISGPAPESRQMYDELKGAVAKLVGHQRDLCSKLATLAMRTIENPAADKKAKEAAFKDMWVVSKGTPHNKQLKRLKEDPDQRAALDQWDLYYHSDQNKNEKAEVLSVLFMTIEEKSNEFELTDKGIVDWMQANGGDQSDFVMLDLGYEYHVIDTNPDLTEEEKASQREALQNEDVKRKERAHNLRQLLRAHLLMERDVDYIIQENKVVIIDENTGRPQPGRRFSDGLHQAIEAKEGCPVQRETQTYATITLQNYFRLYTKLAGMTGTAITEAGEFKEIYKLDVLQIPTHKKCVRQDFNDEIYMTEREKYAAIIKDVKEKHASGRPILIGTESVDISEKLSRILRQNQLQHVVLNAKNHPQEAEIIANAGRRGAITVATNMAGRGTDIKLEAGIAELGGLYVIGTARHQSRRIDLQLRGRCGRQGDPGSSKFYVSFEDQLMRLFASPRITKIMQRFRPEDGEALSAGILNTSIETAQKRVESRNFSIRKHTLEYDDVMNRQRHEIYDFRNDILRGKEIRTIAGELIEDVCFMDDEGTLSKWDPQAYWHWISNLFPVGLPEELFDGSLSEKQVRTSVAQAIEAAFKEKCERENAKFDLKERDLSAEAVRSMMIRLLDILWKQHLLLMDHLRSDVMLRAVAQRDPLIEFKHEAFILFDALSREIKTKIAQNLFRFQLVSREFTGTSVF